MLGDAKAYMDTSHQLALYYSMQLRNSHMLTPQNHI